ncbi:MAG: NAD(P)-dependent oxidoreductase [Nitriliruptorales bacterium]
MYARARAWEPLPGRRLAGSTIVVLGAGAIGRELARVLGPIGARLVAVNRRGDFVEGFGQTRPVRELGRALAGADFLVTTAALTSETERIVDAKVMETLGPSAWLVNLARGRLVDTDALVEALRAGRLGGAALDVTDPEPLPAGHPLWMLPNVLITPHVANPHRGNPWDAHLPELLAHLEGNVRAFAGEEPLAGVIDVEAGY